MSNTPFTQPIYWRSGGPSTENEAALAYPGMLGAKQTAVDKADGYSKTHQLVQSDSTMAVAPYDGAVAWGLMFLLLPEAQRRLIEKIAGILVPGGRFLFTSCAGTAPLVWNDAMTGLESRSLGGVVYRSLLSAVGLTVTSEYEDEGQNHYFDAFKAGTATRRP